MFIDIELILLNIYYTGVAVALLIRDILWLRVVLVLSGIALISYGILCGNITVVMWNFLFLSINTVQIVMLILQRKPVYIDDKLLPVYEKVFSNMRRRDFLTLWKKGHEITGEKKVLCRKGSHQENLYLILDGEAEVIKNGKVIATLSWGDFIAEISFFTGKKASADVISKGTITYMCWSQAVIRKIKQRDSEMYDKLQQILTTDISEKLSKSGN